VSGEAIAKLGQERGGRMDGCMPGCIVKCSIIFNDADGKHVTSAFEYETIALLGTNLGISDPDEVAKMDRFCDEMGLDTISMGVTLAFAMECFEKGYLTEKDTGDVALTFGDREAILRMIRNTAYRKGFGEFLSEGSQRMAARLDPKTATFLYAVKGVEIPGHSARVLKGMSIGYSTGTRGGSHHDTRPTMQYSNDHDNVHPEGQPEFAIRTQHFTAVGDSLTQCRFVSERGYGMTINENYAEMVNAVTGWNLTADDVERIGERICNLERAFNVREGISRQQDRLPPRVMEEPVPSGPHQGMHCSREELDAMLDEYYQLRGWTDQGIPTKDKLRELGLDSIADDLWKAVGSET